MDMIHADWRMEKLLQGDKEAVRTQWGHCSSFDKVRMVALVLSVIPAVMLYNTHPHINSAAYKNNDSLLLGRLWNGYVVFLI